MSADDDFAAEAERLYESWDDETKKRFWAKLLQDDNPPFRMETCWTNDYLFPKYLGSDISRDGLRSLPLPPGPPEEGWQVLDSTHDRRTTWHRLCRDYWGTSRLGAVGRVVARMLQIKPLGKPEG
jgi:hypothetical protein